MSTSPATVGRANLTACLRCRQKKRKCDQSLPKCRPCRLASVECVGYDAVAKRPVPRSYVQNLEDRVASLELKLQQHGLSVDLEATTDSSQGPTPSSTSHHQEPSESWSGTASYQPSSVPSALSSGRDHRDLGTHDPEAQAIACAHLAQTTSRSSLNHDLIWSRIFLENILNYEARPSLIQRAEDRHGSNTPPPPAGGDIVGDLNNVAGLPASLPTMEAAENLVKAYFRLTRANLPLLHEVWFQQKLEHLYSLPRTIDFTNTHTSRTSQMTVFFVFGVFAVAILSLQKENPSVIPTSVADRYYRTSLSGIGEAGLLDDLEGVQALLLLSQYSYHHPSLGSVWRFVGAALRLAVELRFHLEPPPTTSLDPLVIDMRRRAFWVAYAMDRNLAMALALPMSLPDGAITVRFPSEAYDKFITREGIASSLEQIPSSSKLVAIHLLRYRQIQSSIHTVLEQHPSCDSGLIDYNQWQFHMSDRIEHWYKSSPTGNHLGKREKDMVSKFIANYHTAIFRLYRPSVNIPSPSEAQLGIMVQSAAKMIQLYPEYFQNHRLTIYWQSVSNLFSAGVCLMFGYVQSLTIRSTLTRRSLESLVHTCSSVLWGMVERFPSLHNKRNAFDKIAAATFADLDASEDATARLMQNLRGDDTHLANWLSTSHQPLQIHQSGGDIGALTQMDSLKHASLATYGPIATEHDVNLFNLEDFDLSNVDWDCFMEDNTTFPLA